MAPAFAAPAPERKSTSKLKDLFKPKKGKASGSSTPASTSEVSVLFIFWRTHALLSARRARPRGSEQVFSYARKTETDVLNCPPIHAIKLRRP